ncbi:bifunctional N-acetylglucosamine-1-phosphate-uridyltransferase/glucosamine-1-phosphate-acetyltransferase GlmU-like protein [Variovorax boronicumulans]|uniref:Bifunctional N-acetylglucosamine-1-phosphate-uridyltransferase/glucosamine-1-phosphate-acetyltransferase GlmU-like protein n=2 Tax=Variovorax TaxID=34072 RepID=A0AAW8CZB2_9BURK|nr:LpxA family transferase [Variovorax boronicumulans]MDP9894242.1 bifunctional N-acetylglucosamine-1-phosphate-uridyltransferase/glucosamine-1-phosphate-acetyltransferase GlmU-like protein [Variovorax boronicumulans]MDQ0054061.1 bifunctional N-acetylglucosamine-1-phosphate-uridyltransferase/glucosamine-1-phosphate-acetyltransferase GlmU-like protein [Variovorax boronicumulans]
MPHAIDLASYIAGFAVSPLARWRASMPWELAMQAPNIVRRLLAELPDEEYAIKGDIAIHRSARVEAAAVLKGPLILGADCLVAAGAYLRGGNWIDARCTVGPGTELKSSFVFAGTALAHFNFVGDSVIGAGVNMEAGSIVCNHRNERAAKEIFVRSGEGGALQPTGCEKFGALIGDGARIGANAVVAPGALLRPGHIVGRASLLDQELPGRE